MPGQGDELLQALLRVAPGSPFERAVGKPFGKQPDGLGRAV